MLERLRPALALNELLMSRHAPTPTSGRSDAGPDHFARGYSPHSRARLPGFRREKKGAAEAAPFDECWTLNKTEERGYSHVQRIRPRAANFHASAPPGRALP